MKMKYAGSSLLFLSFFVLSLHPGYGQTASLQLDGKSTLLIENRSKDSVEVSLENWYLLPWKAQELDTVLLAGDSLEYELITQGETYFDLTVGEKDLKLFSRPNATCRIRIGADSEIRFFGPLSVINQFLRKKANVFHSVDADWKPRGNYVHGDYSLDELLRANDSITQVHLAFLREYGQDLPGWFVSFEKKRLSYLNAGSKLNSLAHRKVLLGKQDAIPPDLLERVLDTLPVEDPGMLGNIRYLQFLLSYVSHCKDPGYEKGIPASREAWAAHFARSIEVVNERLSGEVREAYLSFSFGNIIDRKRPFFVPEWLDLIEDEALRDHLQQQLEVNPVLPPGAKAPYFYLPDTSGIRYEPRQFKGRIVLINFWATWCKPCIQEFPYENQLVDEFRDEPVRVINICLDSNEEKWEAVIEQHGLKTLNLFAVDQWNDKLYLDFEISALPHSTLIDWYGKVVQNKCHRASEGVAQEIWSLLKRMKMGAEQDP